MPTALFNVSATLIRFTISFTYPLVNSKRINLLCFKSSLELNFFGVSLNSKIFNPLETFLTNHAGSTCEGAASSFLFGHTAHFSTARTKK